MSVAEVRPRRAQPAAAHDPRLDPPVWPSSAAFFGTRSRLRLLIAFDLVLAVWYIGWLLQPARVGNPLLYGLLVAVEAFNLLQAGTFWWTVLAQRSRPRPVKRPAGRTDVMIPVYNEPVDVVEPTVAAACRLGEATVYLLDDRGRPELAELAGQYGARYLRRADHRGAKAGNLNHALARTDAPFVAVLDCDHVADRRFLDATLPAFADADLAFVQTPQYYANSRVSSVARAAWSQQALFFGAIAQGKDGLGSMFCCGTNVVFRRKALEEVGGFPERSLTEDFELSIRLHERGWHSAYVPEVLARGLGPEDAASYAGQQLRWARGCLSAIGTILRARLPWRQRIQYLVSAGYFLTGWTFLVYMSLPVAHILTGAQPLAAATAASFLAHFAPYFALSLLTVATAGAGSYAFSAYALGFANFWIHVVSTVLTLARRRGRFVVTPKGGGDRRQPRAVAPALAAVAVLVGVAIYGLTKSTSPSMLNNVAFAAVHVSVLMAGVWGALTLPSTQAVPAPAPVVEGPAPPRRGSSRARPHGVPVAPAADPTPGRQPVASRRRASGRPRREVVPKTMPAEYVAADEWPAASGWASASPRASGARRGSTATGQAPGLRTRAVVPVGLPPEYLAALDADPAAWGDPSRRPGERGRSGTRPPAPGAPPARSRAPGVTGEWPTPPTEPPTFVLKGWPSAQGAGPADPVAEETSGAWPSPLGMPPRRSGGRGDPGGEWGPPPGPARGSRRPGSRPRQ